MTRKHLLIFSAVAPLLTALSLSASAQSLKGRVIDENNEPLAYANVMLQKADSSYLSGTMTDTLGVFSLNSDPKAAMIMISFIGYEPYVVDIKDTDLGTIRMTPDSEMLGKAVVKGYLPKTVIQGDAFVTPVENSVLSEAGSANDVLKKLPGVISKDGGYEVIGKGAPAIYINGRLVRNDSELEQLNSKEIKAVEVVQNPGARYDATVKAVIRIKTVKRTGDGFGFDVRSTWSQSDYTNLNETVNMNYRHNDLDVFGSLAYSEYEYFQDTDMYQTLKSKQFLETQQYGHLEGRTRTLTPVLGANWQLGENHSVGVRYRPTLSLGSTSMQDFRTSARLDGSLDDETNTVADGYSGFTPAHEMNMYYNGNAGRMNIDFNADFHDSRSNEVKTYNEVSKQQDDRILNTSSNTHNRLYASKLTLTYPLLGGMLTAGSEYSHTSRYDEYINGEGYVPSAYTTIRESELSAYVEYARPLKFGSLTAGVRYEHIGFNYYENEVRKEDQSREYSNFYPNASFAAVAGPFQFLLNYSAKTTRPHYSYLSNSLVYIDRYSMQQGNPLLRPEINHDVSLAAVWKFIQAMVSWQMSKNAILYNATAQKGKDNAIVIYYDNFDRNIPTVQAVISATPTIGIWHPRLTLALVKQWLTMESQGKEVSLNQPLPVIQFGNTLVLPKGFMLNADYSFQGKGDSRVYHMMKATNGLNASVRKAFLDNALTVEIFANDILDGNEVMMTLYSDTYTLKQWSKVSMRTYGITLRYNFNTTQSKYKGTGAGAAQKERMQ
ncbi:MAG: outer membrane beta-barrel protein [Bacteroidales bacterium]|nr:outer membrane beta-barrel protein [Bacteroidales bacterium]